MQYYKYYAWSTLPVTILLGVPNGMLHTETKFQSKQIVTHDYHAVPRETKELGGLRGYKYKFAYEGDHTF